MFAQIINIARRPRWAQVLILIALQLMVLWMPFGFKNRPIAEEWQFFILGERGSGLFHTEPIFELRPLDGTWFYIARMINPDSLIGLHILTIGIFFLKGILAYAIARRLMPDNTALGVLVAVLFVVYPADAGLFNFRSYNIHIAATLYFLALLLLITAFQQTSIRNSVILAFLMCSALGATLLTYDSFYPLILLTPLVLVWMARRISRRVMLLSILWYGVSVPLFLNLVQIVFLQQRPGEYQIAILDKEDLLSKVVQSLVQAYRINFYGGWRDTVRSIDLRSPLLYLAVIFGIAVAWLVWYFGAQTESGQKTRPYWPFVLAGFLFVGIAFLPYTITSARFDDWRVFIGASFGSTLVIGTGLYMISLVFKTHRRVAFAVLGGACVALATYHALQQHQLFVTEAESTRQLESDIVRQAPQFLDKSAVLVLMPSDNNVGSLLFPDAFRYIYQDYTNILNVSTCIPLSEAEFASRIPRPWASCIFHQAGVELMFVDHAVGTYGYDQVVLFSYSPGSHATLIQDNSHPVAPGIAFPLTNYAPDKLINGNISPSRRAEILLGPFLNPGQPTR